MDLASFKVSITQLNDDELMALLADLRTSRRPVTDITEVKERAKTKARSSGGGKASLASLKGSLTKAQLELLIAKLTEAS
jgi:hypothetical protein